MDCPVLAFNLRLPAKQQKQTNKQQQNKSKTKKTKHKHLAKLQTKKQTLHVQRLEAHFKWRPFEVDQPDSIIFQYLKLRMPITS